MEFRSSEVPFAEPASGVAAMMLGVLAALVPAAVVHVWFFGPGLLLNLAVAAVTCTLAEFLVIIARGRSPGAALGDCSALVTAALLAFSLPPLLPWWVTATGAVFAIVLAKHLYGGLGFNIFNPAMAGYVAIFLAFPLEMNLWPAPLVDGLVSTRLTLMESLTYTLRGALPEPGSFDVISRATPLDAMQTGLRDMLTVSEIQAGALMGGFGGRGWAWIAIATAIGGMWLLARKFIRWHIPCGVLAGLLVPATVAYLIDPGSQPGPAFHLLSGATMLCAFFIATDPVSAATSPKGRLLYGAGIGLLAYAIRRWGAYADGFAFAVLLMNMAVPAIDKLSRPRIVGHP